MKQEFYTHVQAYGNKIVCRGYRNGQRFREVVNYKPYLYLQNKGELKNKDAVTIEGDPVSKLNFDSLKEARDFIERYKEVKDFKYYGLINFIYPFINDRFPGAIHKRYDPSLISIVSLDIEVASPDGFPDLETADQPVTAITLTRKGKALTFGMKSYESKNPNVEYVGCHDEAHLFEQFLKRWSTDHYWMPDVVTGWSIEFFDIPYIIRRIIRVIGEKKVNLLSPNALVKERQITIGKNTGAAASQENVFEISGISILDYLQLYKRFTYTTQESYSLKNISQIELGETKLEYDGTLEELYHNDFEKFIDYNIQDAFLVERLEHKLNFIQQVIAIAYRAKVNYIDAMTTSRPWDVIIHNHLADKGITVPQYQAPDHSEMIIGAYVKEPVTGMHHNIVSVDFDSLYPRIISQQNISNDTLVDIVKVPTLDQLVMGVAIPYQTEYTICANGSRYRKDKRGFIPELVDQFIQERVDFKKEMIALEKLQEANPTDKRAIEIKHLDNYQKSWKILTNGLYGALALKYFRWYDVRLAEAVTTTGQLAVRWVERDINKYLNGILKTKDIDYVIASDTDSCYINLNPLVQKIYPAGEKREFTTKLVIDYLDKAMQKGIEPMIKKSCSQLCDLLNVYVPKLSMKREAICDKAIWRAKKNYILNVWDNEGVRYKEPKIKMKGIEAIRASTPIMCRDAIKKVINILMNKTETDLQSYVTDFKETFYKQPFEKVAFPRSVNSLEVYWNETSGFQSKCPPNVHGSINYNNLLKQKKLTGKYHLIKNKDKIRWAWLKQPNPLHGKTIAAFDELPKEFKLQDFIDYDMQYEKTFLSPIKSITDIIGWNTSYIPTLKKFFRKKENA